jgi:hypothetical protein
MIKSDNQILSKLKIALYPSNFKSILLIFYLKINLFLMLI